MSGLPEDVKADVIDLREPLRKASGERKVYYATDTHWNSFGAWTGYREIAKALGVEPIPFFKKPDDLFVRPYSGDLASMMGLEAIFQEQDVALTPEATLSLLPCRSPTYNTPLVRTYECPSGQPGKLVMYVDSFGAGLEPYMSSMYQQSTFLTNGNTMDLQWLRDVKPAMVIDEAVERALERMVVLPSVFERAPPESGPSTPNFGCSIEAIRSEENTGPGTRIVRIGGWSADLQRGVVPDRVWLVLSGEGGTFSAEAVTNRIQPAMRRVDIGRAFNNPRLETAVFDFSGIASALPPGAYGVTVLGQFDQQVARCTTTASLTLAP